MANQKNWNFDLKQPLAKLPKRTAAAKKYFFLDGKLYKVLKQLKSADILTVWSYEDDKTVHFVFSEAKKKMRPAFNTREVADMVCRADAVVRTYVNDGYINSPARLPEYGMNVYGQPFSHMKWSEDDVLALHDYLITRRMSKDGKIKPVTHKSRLPTRKELIALMKQEPLFYMQTSDGDIVPVWSAYNQ